MSKQAFVPTEPGYYWCNEVGKSHRMMARLVPIKFGQKEELAACFAGSGAFWELGYFENWSQKIEEAQNV